MLGYFFLRWIIGQSGRTFLTTSLLVIFSILLKLYSAANLTRLSQKKEVDSELLSSSQSSTLANN